MAMYSNAYGQSYPQYGYYPPAYAPTMQQPMMQQQMPLTSQQTAQPVQQPTQTPPIQNGGFVQIRSEEEVKSWPTAPGNTVTFIDETRTHLYTKTATYNQLEAPIIVRYQVIREDEPIAPVSTATPQAPDYALKKDLDAVVGALEGCKKEFDAIHADIDKMSGDLYGIAGKKKAPAKKQEVEADE